MIQPVIAHPSPLTRAKRLPLEVPPSALTALADAVGTMHRAFCGHVARQEGRCGFFAFLSSAAPRYAAHLERLGAEHDHLASALGALRLKILRAEPAEWEGLVAEADAIADALADHEALEREMLMDGLESP